MSTRVQLEVIKAAARGPRREIKAVRRGRGDTEDVAKESWPYTGSYPRPLLKGERAELAPPTRDR